MQTPIGHLTYCSNIHAGETWKDHFARLKEFIPGIRQAVSPGKPFGIGLRLSNVASLELRKENNLRDFQSWLSENDCYVFTMNGFPYGEFHHAIVKDQVHAPDWTHPERVQYTIRLAQILAVLLPEGMDGGISTSPLSYRPWFSESKLEAAYEKSTFNLLEVVSELIRIRQTTGKLIHLDIEPEPDGLLGEGRDFLNWYEQYLLPMGGPLLDDRFNYSAGESDMQIREHVCICYDVCHFAICYEDHTYFLRELKRLGIKTGKIQISAALKAMLMADPADRTEQLDAFNSFNEPVYLHQVVARKNDDSLVRYHDLPEALKEGSNPEFKEWRAHFHVPLFMDRYGLLESTRQDIREVLDLQKELPFTNHLEIETYTWEVLPKASRLPLEASIIRELSWVLDLIKPEATRSQLHVNE